jgi:hypothetical protein
MHHNKVLLLFLISCANALQGQNNTDSLFSIDSTLVKRNPKTIKHAYRLGRDSTKHWERTIELPAKGRFVEESHYVTNMDAFPNQRLFANSLTERIDFHLKQSLISYLEVDSSMTFDSLYLHSWQKQWTPAERGQIGQGSVGVIQTKELTVWDEMWMMNMMWAPGHRPKRGSKFLMTYQGKSVVVIAGYETGPSSNQYLGGCTTEVHAYLGTTNASEILVEYLEDQEVSSGPVLP